MSSKSIVHSIRFSMVVAIVSSLGALNAQGQEVSKPVYRVEQAQAQEPTNPTSSEQQFDLTPREGEHPLMPCIRVAKEALANIDRDIQDYSCTFSKIERIDGKLTDQQHMSMKVRHRPFSVYMKFLKPFAGREVLYVDGQNNGNLVALEAGWKRNFGKVNLDPKGSMAMSGQKYPITRAGIRNLTNELIEIAEADTKYGECEVKTAAMKINDRPVTLIESTHPVPRREFRYHKAKIYIDNELRIPVAYEAFLWPSKPGGEPVLEEQFIYTNIKLNNGFTDQDFDPENPALFKP
jgi:hypothetical protein